MSFDDDFNNDDFWRSKAPDEAWKHRMVSTREAARITGMRIRTIRCWCMAGYFSAVKAGRSWVIDRESLPPPRVLRPPRGPRMSKRRALEIIAQQIQVLAAGKYKPRQARVKGHNIRANRQTGDNAPDD